MLEAARPVTGLLKIMVTGIGDWNVPGESADVRTTEGGVLSNVTENGAAAVFACPEPSSAAPAGTCTLTVTGPGPEGDRLKW